MICVWRGEDIAGELRRNAQIRWSWRGRAIEATGFFGLQAVRVLKGVLVKFPRQSADREPLVIVGRERHGGGWLLCGAEV